MDQSQIKTAFEFANECAQQAPIEYAGIVFARVFDAMTYQPSALSSTDDIMARATSTTIPEVDADPPKYELWDMLDCLKAMSNDELLDMFQNHVTVDERERLRKMVNALLWKRSGAVQ